MRAPNISVAILGCLLAFGCSTNQKEYGKLEKAGDDTKLYISFSAESADYQRTVSEINRTAIGWIENGTWRASNDAGVAVVKIYVATLYDGRAFQKKHIREMRSRARGFSDQSILDFGEQGIIKTDSGQIEYLFYRQGSQPCVFIRKYWSDPELQGDVNQLHGLLAWVAGTSIIYASDCRPGGRDLQLPDLKLLFNGIKARNLYWPDNMFVSVDGMFNRGSAGLESVTLQGQTPPAFDLSGIYTSKVLRKDSSSYWCFNHKRTFMMELIQKGNRIKGTFMSGITGEISGKINKDKVVFTWYTAKCNAGYEGEWTVDSSGSRLQGFGLSELDWEAQKNN